MKIFVACDLHEEEAVLDPIESLSSTHDYTFICGDISHTNYFITQCLEKFKNSFFIPGNWDNELVNKVLEKSPQMVHRKRVELKNGYNVVGFGYSLPTPFATFGELTEEQIYEQMSKLPINDKTLLLLHCPPKGYFDLSRRNLNIGSVSILKIIEEKQPFAVFCGHVHERVGSARIGKTQLIKLPPANEMRACSFTITDSGTICEFVNL